MEIREYRTATRCEHRRRLRGCREPLVGQCQYCARGFCAAHGAVHGDGQHICVDERCARLHADVAAHLDFKHAARARNAEGACGETACAQPHSLLCDRCLCRYCEDHMAQVILTVTRGGELQTEAAAMCDHCRARLPLWSDSSG